MSRRERYFNMVVLGFWAIIGVILVLSLLRFQEVIFDREGLTRRIAVADSLEKIWMDTAMNRIRIDSARRWIIDSLANEDSSGIDFDFDIDTSGIDFDFDPDSTARRRQPDSARRKDEFIIKRWKWVNAKGRQFSIMFRIRKSEYAASYGHRMNSSLTGPELWQSMYERDREALSDMVQAYRDLIVGKRLGYYEAMDAVVSSIQKIPYTFVLAGDSHCGGKQPKGKGTYPALNCAPHGYPSGCCDDVRPWGVYSPLEFAVKETGDCDTKSLIAYVILEELNPLLKEYGYTFDVAMMRGEVEAGNHAMLGVNIPNPPFRTHYSYDARRNRYYAWEVTTTGNALGARVWDTFNNWHSMKLN